MASPPTRVLTQEIVIQMSQVLGGEFFLPATAVNLSLQPIKCRSKSGISGRADGHDLGEFGAEQPCIRACEEQGNTQSCGGGLVAMDGIQ